MREFNLLKLFWRFLIIILSEQSWANSTKHNLLVKSGFRKLKVDYIYIPNQSAYLFWAYCVQITLYSAVGKHSEYWKPLLAPKISTKLECIENFNIQCFANIGKFYVVCLERKVYIFYVSPMVRIPVQRIYILIHI